MRPNADGPDLSHYQQLTGQAVPKSWRLCSHKATEGANGVDPMFARRWAWMRGHPFPYRGAYHWLRSDSTVAVQAAHLCAVLDSVGGLQRGEFVEVDWERTPNIDVPTSLEEAEFRDRVEQHHCRACTITYVSDWMPDSTRDPDRVAEFVEWRQENPDAPLWYANYLTVSNGRQPPNADGWTECAAYHADVWQHTSSATDPSIASSAAGGSSGFDMNHVFNWATLDRITDQTPASTPAPIPEDDMTRYIIIDKRMGGAGYWADTLAPVSGDVVAAAQGDPTIKVIEQDHEVTTDAMLHRNGSTVAVALEKFRDSRDGIAD